MNSIKRVVLALGLISLGAVGQVVNASCGVSGSCCSSSCDSGCDDCKCYGGYFTNKSYFSDKIGAFQSATFLRDALFRIDAADDREDGFGGAIQVVPFGGRTTDHGSKELARWFGYNHKGVCGCPIVFAEARNVDIDLSSIDYLVAGADIDVRHFNVRTTTRDFKSSVTFSPRQKFFGVGLDWKQVLFFNDDNTRRWWFEVAAPIVHIENDMRMCETVDSSSGTEAYVATKGLDDSAYVTSVAAAFSQSSWKYGKILSCATGANCGSSCVTSGSSCATCCTSDSCNGMKKTRISDIELKLGYNQSLAACSSLDTYLGMVLPTGNKAKGEYVFEAIVGNGQHWGIMLGGELGFDLFHHDCGDFKWFAAADLRYLFHNEQVRSFDLVGKPWSRYQTMFATKDKMLLGAEEDTEENTTSGINLMTRCVKVHPRCQFNFDTSFAWDGEHFVAEAGYGLYARQAERIDPSWNEGPILAALVFDHPVTLGGITPLRTMRDSAYSASVLDKDLAAELYDTFKIKTCDIDWNSASHPAVMSNSLYASLGYKWGDACYPTMLSVGGGWDFAFSNTAMHKWTLFGKLGVSF